MGYKLLGFAVWQVGKWYVRRGLPGAPPRAVILATAGGLMLAGGLAVASRRGTD